MTLSREVGMQCSVPPITTFAASDVELDSGLPRREFIRRACLIAAATVGLPKVAAADFFDAAIAGKKPSVIWLHFQECTGCTESLLRTEHPPLDDLILDAAVQVAVFERGLHIDLALVKNAGTQLHRIQLADHACWQSGNGGYAILRTVEHLADTELEVAE